MANLIDRDSLMAQLEDRQAFLVKEWGYRDHYTRGFEEAVDKVEKAPVIDAVEVVHSAWVLNDGSGTCKHCHRTTKNCWDYDSWMNYCPNCGAKMEGGNDT